MTSNPNCMGIAKRTWPFLISIPLFILPVKIRYDQSNMIFSNPVEMGDFAYTHDGGDTPLFEDERPNKLEKIGLREEERIKEKTRWRAKGIMEGLGIVYVGLLAGIYNAFGKRKWQN